MIKSIFLSGILTLSAFAADCQTAPALLTAKSFFKKPYHIPVSKTPATISTSMLVSPSFSTTKLPFFCRQEIRFEHATKIPLKFRLGSVPYVDYLERKKGAAIIP